MQTMLRKASIPLAKILGKIAVSVLAIAYPPYCLFRYDNG
jgi:hypothetical protein